MTWTLDLCRLSSRPTKSQRLQSLKTRRTVVIKNRLARLSPILFSVVSAPENPTIYMRAEFRPAGTVFDNLDFSHRCP